LSRYASPQCAVFLLNRTVDGKTTLKACNGKFVSIEPGKNQPVAKDTVATEKNFLEIQELKEE
jgi:hypothetical protein